MKEYEYSFKVDSIKPYIDYCISNNFKEVSIMKETRVIYENKNNNLIARLTTNDKKETILDFKKVYDKEDFLKISKESLPVIVTENNKESIDSMLEVLEFYIVCTNIRTRYIYELDNVKFEIDSYVSPKMQVVAIEGDKKKVDEIYNELKRNYL